MKAVSLQGSVPEWFYSLDGLGSVTELTNTAGSVVEKYTYDSFGKPAIKNQAGTIYSSSPLGNPYLYTSREYEPETALYHYRARYYSPTLGRFLQADPIGYEGGINLYSYTKNNPVNWVDPFGLDKQKTLNYQDTFNPYDELSWGRHSQPALQPLGFGTNLGLTGLGEVMGGIGSIETMAWKRTLFLDPSNTYLGMSKTLQYNKPWRTLGKTGAALGVAMTAWDVTTTFTNPNLNLGQKVLKAGIQVTGAGVTFGAGVSIGGLSILSGPGAAIAGTTAAVASSTLVTLGQEYLYKKWELQ